MQRRWLQIPSVRRQIERLSLEATHRGTVRASFQPLRNSSKISSSSCHYLQTWSFGENNRESFATDTIYALSTASGRAAIAVIRISGPACRSIYEALCPNRPPLKPRIASVRKLHHPQNSSQILDTAALTLFFPSPNTVTGEDVLEFHVHGGPAIIRSVLDAVSQCPVQENHMTIRHAEAGEFTKRAFYNNRIDLTQAEALGESLAAETEQQRRLAVNGSSSVLANRYEEWHNLLLYARGELEALIDFSEDQHFDESPNDFILGVSKQVVELKTMIQFHIHNASKGELLRNGIRVALLGAPNAGKSSLLNRIVGREAAIVSPEEGTTRDIVEVSVDIEGWLVNLGDMAGLRNNTFNLQANVDISNVGLVEREGIRRARKRALQSDLIIALIPLQRVPNGLIELVLNDELVSAIKECKAAGKDIVFVINKIDLLREQILPHRQSLSSFLCHLMEAFSGISPNDVFCLSCTDAEIANLNEPDSGGIQTLLSGLSKKFGSMTSALVGENSPTAVVASDVRNYWDASLSVTHRQSVHLKDCLNHLNNFLASANAAEALPNESEILLKPTYHVDDHFDLVAENSELNESKPKSESLGSEIDIVAAAEHLRYAANCLARITGRAGAGDVEDVLGVVFEK